MPVSRHTKKPRRQRSFGNRKPRVSVLVDPKWKMRRSDRALLTAGSAGTAAAVEAKGESAPRRAAETIA